MKGNTLKRILFILTLPPPQHGAALVGSYLKNSELVNNTFLCKYVNLGTSVNLDEIGRFGILKLPRLAWKLILIFKELIIFNPELIYFTPTSKGIGMYKDMLILALLKISKKKIVMHFHNKGISQMSKRSYNDYLFRLAFKNSYFILLSPLLYSDIDKYVPPERVYFCANGVPEDTVDNYKKTENSLPQIFFLSNMMIAKGVYDLLDACRILKIQNFNFKCHFVGRWMDVTCDEFNEQVKKLGLTGHVHFHGSKYGKEKEAFFKTADIFVLPSKDEAFPLVIIEAMKFRLPVISTNVGGIPDIVDNGDTGFLAEKDNPSDLAEKIKILLTRPDLRVSMGNKGYEKYMRNYTHQIWEKKIVQILSTISQL